MLRRRILSPATNLFDEAGSMRFRATAHRYMWPGVAPPASWFTI